VDSIVDTVGGALALHRLGIEAVYVSPIHTGRGFVRGAHGVIPVPGPATLELVKGVPIYSRDIATELLTPTGAALLTTAASGYGPLPAMTVTAVGYGAGKKEIQDLPNLLRVVIGERGPGAGPFQTDQVAVLEANLDDMNPEYFQYALDKLFAAGALDVYFTPVQMKKGRPGTLVTVISPADREEVLAATLLRETTTLGVRSYGARRRKLEREKVAVETPYGPVGVKVGRAGGEPWNIAPEYEDCRATAEAAGVPLKHVYQAALAAAWQRFGPG
jgi:uncharacterized protein (TIGR00299 family) protein